MKKIIVLLLVSMLFVTTGCGAKQPDSGAGNSACSTLKVFNWGVYIGKGVKEDFEKKYNVKVIYDQFASNEEMYTKLLSGEVYDVLYPSDYMIERLITEDRLQKIDLNKITNFKDLLPEVVGWNFDAKNEYSVPYFWGNVGLLYNKKKVDFNDLKTQGFNIMRNPKYAGKIYVYDSERDAFMMALKALGYSMNTTDSKEINEAYEWLLAQKKEMSPIYVTDDVIDNMTAGLKDISFMYSGDAVAIMMENPDMAYFVPDSGSNIWVDAMVIPANSTCGELAHAWINYQLEADVATKNTEEVGYTTTVKSVYDEVTASDGEFAKYPSYKIVHNNNDEIFRYNEDIKKILSDLWTRVKVS